MIEKQRLSSEIVSECPRVHQIELLRSDIQQLAEQLMDAEDYALANRFLQAALVAIPDDLQLLSCAGSCLQELRRWPEAKPILERAAALDPTGKADLELAWAALDFNAFDVATAALLRTLDKDPRHVHEIAWDACTWEPIRYELTVLQAIERAESQLLHLQKPARHPMM